MVEIRQFEISELGLYLAIRRDALVMNPEAFGDSVAKFDARDPSIDRERFRRHVSQTDHVLVGAFDGDQCVGMTALVRNTEPEYQDRGTIWGVFVNPEYRGQKLGERMFAEVFDVAKDFDWLNEIVLSVKSDNRPAIKLYEQSAMETFEPAENDPVFSSPCAQETHMRWKR